jgi:hypothetical protein
MNLAFVLDQKYFVYGDFGFSFNVKQFDVVEAAWFYPKLFAAGFNDCVSHGMVVEIAVQVADESFVIGRCGLLTADCSPAFGMS